MNLTIVTWMDPSASASPPPPQQAALVETPLSTLVDHIIMIITITCHAFVNPRLGSIMIRIIERSSEPRRTCARQHMRKPVVVHGPDDPWSTSSAYHDEQVGELSGRRRGAPLDEREA